MTDQTPAEIRTAALNEGADAVQARVTCQTRTEANGKQNAIYVLRRLADEALPRDPLAAVLAEVRAERARQDAEFGEQNHPNGTGRELEILPNWTAGELADAARDSCRIRADMNICTWSDILTEEACEALAEDDPAKLRTELIQIAAVSVAWIQAIDRHATSG